MAEFCLFSEYIRDRICESVKPCGLVFETVKALVADASANSHADSAGSSCIFREQFPQKEMQTVEEMKKRVWYGRLFVTRRGQGCGWLAKVEQRQCAFHNTLGRAL